MEINPALDEPASDSDSEISIEDEDEDNHGAFSEIMDAHINMLQNDENDAFEPATASAEWELCTIAALFDFS